MELALGRDRRRAWQFVSLNRKKAFDRVSDGLKMLLVAFILTIYYVIAV